MFSKSLRVKKILMLILLTLLTLTAVPLLNLNQTMVYAENDQVSILLKAAGDAGTKLTLIDKSSKEKARETVIDDSMTGEFFLSYDEPGNYYYLLKDSNSNKNIDVSVVVIYDSSNNLRAIAVAECNGIKVKNISFVTPKVDDVGTGTRMIPVYGYSAVIIISIISIWLLIAAGKKGKKRARK